VFITFLLIFFFYHALILKYEPGFFHICTVHPASIKVFYYQLIHKRIVFKGILKFTLNLK